GTAEPVGRTISRTGGRTISRPGAEALGRDLDGFVDLGIAGTAAEVAGQGVADFLARRRVVLLEQRPGTHEHAGGAEAALRTAGHLEGVLQRVQVARAGQPLD